MLRTLSHPLKFNYLTRLHTCLTMCAVMGLLHFSVELLQADPIPSGDGYWPLRHDLPPGTNARFAGGAGVIRPGMMQTVEFILPVKGHVTVYSTGYPQGVTFETPCKVGLEAGHVHRVKIHDLAGFPGVEFYPSFEIIDRIHPPCGDPQPDQQSFAVPLEITEKELLAVIQDRMINKVIYLEDPKFANLIKHEGEKVYTEEFRPRDNLLKEADLRGRPLVIMRLGSRQISPQEQHLLMGTGGQIMVSTNQK